jgi:hypothetical protein
MRLSNFKACKLRINGKPKKAAKVDKLKGSRVLFALLILLVTFVTLHYGLSTDLPAQVTGTVRISVGGPGTTSTTTTVTSISTSVTPPSSTTATSPTTIILTTSTMTSTNMPELRIGPMVLACTIGLVLSLCGKHRRIANSRLQ